DGQTRRVKVGRGGAASHRQQDDGAPADRPRRYPGAAGLQGRTLGNLRGRVGRARCSQRSRAPPATRKSRLTLLYLSMTWRGGPHDAGAGGPNNSKLAPLFSQASPAASAMTWALLTTGTA